jgi:PAS domain S-box-containing protein
MATAGRETRINHRIDRKRMKEAHNHRLAGKKFGDTSSRSVNRVVSSGSMAELIRSYPWEQTALGAMEHWPERLQSAIDTVLGCGFACSLLWGREFVQIYNDPYIALLGARHPASLGRPVFEGFPEAHDTLDRLLHDVHQGETVVLPDQHYAVLRNGDPEDAWFRMSYSPIHGKAGEVAGVLAIGMETTDRVVSERDQGWHEAERDAELKRKNFQVQLSNALRPLADPFAIQSEASRLLGEHLGAQRVFYADMEDGNFVVRRGYAQGVPPMAGQHTFSHFSAELVADLRRGKTVVVDDLARQVNLTEENRAAYRSAQIAALIAVPLVKDNQWVVKFAVHSSRPRAWTADEIKLVQEVGELTWSAVERARTEEALRESEQRFRLLVENLREYALVQTDPNGLVTSWNPGAERLFGYTSAEVVGQPFSRLISAEGGPREPAEQDSQETSGETARWLTRKDGSRFWARWISEPVYDDGGQLRGVAKLMRDETEREEAEQTIRRSLAEKDELLKEVHHRVKNNLQVIISLLNLQARQIKEERVLTLFEETRNRVQSIAAIHELLYRAESFASIQLPAYARQLVPGLVRFYGLERQVQVELLGDGATLELERAVPFGILLNELVSNACKHAFSARSEGAITVSIWPKNGHIELTVADNGTGLPENFDYRHASSLGLKLVHGLVHQLRGKLHFRSEAGTTIWVQFPANATGADA